MKKIVLPFGLFFCIVLLYSAQAIYANNIRLYDKDHADDLGLVSDPLLVGRDKDGSIPANYYAIEFNFMWDNSWKTSNPRNWDAAWVFAKYNMGGSGWKHVWLADTGSGIPKHGVDKKGGGFCKGATKGQRFLDFVELDYVVSPGYSYVPEVGKSVPVGVFIHREKNGYGGIQFEKFRLFWEYGNQDIYPDDPIQIAVFGLEMVYVPDGEFRLGTGGDENFAFRVSYFTPTGGAGTTNNDNGLPYIMRKEDSLVLVQYCNNAGPIPGYDSTLLSRKGSSNTTAIIMAGNNAVNINARIPIPKDFPKGTKAFYMMKYEITQEGYINFLNTLSIEQQGVRAKGGPLVIGDKGTQLGRYNKATYRNGVTLFELSGTGTFVSNMMGAGITKEDVNQLDDGQNIAMGYLCQRDILAYLGWAALRPFTEFEFEKACRGPLMPVKNEYAWGNTNVNPCVPADNNVGVFRPGFNNERPKGLVTGIRPNANIGGSNIAPIRVGCFADSVSSRAEAGASFWGIMELTGNLAEFCISAESKTATSLFRGTHAYGELDPLTAEVPSSLNWPSGNDSRDYAWRGGWLGGAASYGAISDRYYSVTATSAVVSYGHGGRGVRTALSKE